MDDRTEDVVSTKPPPKTLTMYDLQMIVSKHFNAPVVLRTEKEENILCPYCELLHSHGNGVGHRVSQCQNNKTIDLNGIRYGGFHGYHIVVYEKTPGKTKAAKDKTAKKKLQKLRITIKNIPGKQSISKCMQAKYE
jgi:hypothetical protein